MAYYAAREAISSWGNEFGYQLIEDDWTIAYPPPDVAIAEAENRAIEESRRRLQWLAETHPQRPAKPQRQYRAAPTRGGVVENGGPSVLGDQSQFEWKDQPGGGTPTPGGSRGGQSFNGGGPGVAAAAHGVASGPGGTGGTGNGTGGGSGQGYGAGAAQGQAGGDGVAPGRPFLSAAGTPDDPAGDAILASGRGMGGGPGGGVGGPGGTVQGDGGGMAGNGPEGTPGAPGGVFGKPGLAGQPGQSGTEGGAGGSGEAGGDAGGDGAGRYGAAGSSFAGGATGSAAGGAAGGAASGAASGSTSGGAGSGNLGLGGSASGASGGAGGDVSMPGMLSVGGGAGGAGGGSGSLANSRGANWASLATQDRPVPLTRPIRVECGLNEFRILDDAGRRIQTRVPIDGDTASAIDPFVGALHTKVKNWGLAGDRMYWRPELVLSATSDGQSRRDDLERLLADSGIDVRPRDAKEERVEPLPPVQRASYNLPLK
jgi:hypothetical protein